jgi:hypothetical protein
MERSITLSQQLVEVIDYAGVLDSQPYLLAVMALMRLMEQVI